MFWKTRWDTVRLSWWRSALVVPNTADTWAENNKIGHLHVADTSHGAGLGPKAIVWLFARKVWCTTRQLPELCLAQKNTYFANSAVAG